MINFSNIQAVVVDFEGTIVSIPSVRDTLFPYAKKQIEDGYIQAHADQLANIIKAICTEMKKPNLSPDECAAQALTWMAADQKIGPLKELQGIIWHEGYENGDLKGQLYDDAAAQLQAWKTQGKQIIGYSSGSVQAQKDLVTYTANHGDLSAVFDKYFDTKVGGKKEPASYTAIAQSLGFAPGNILFISDTPEELSAARTAGFLVVGSQREDNLVDLATRPEFPYVTTFNDIQLHPALAA